MDHNTLLKNLNNLPLNMGQFAIKHVTSSPKYPTSNGLVEAAVKNVKNLIKHSNDPYLALLAYRNTPLTDLMYSPAELLMGRRLRCDLPIAPQNLLPKIHDYAADIDIFGQASLFQFIHRSTSQQGHQTLANWLLQPADQDARIPGANGET